MFEMLTWQQPSEPAIMQLLGQMEHMVRLERLLLMLLPDK